MSSFDCDISWAMLRRVIRGWAGDGVDLLEHRPLAGGNINTTLALSLSDQRQVVLKITPHRIDLNYADEVAQLSALAAAGVPTPSVLKLYTGSLDEPYSYLLLEFVQGCDLNAARGRCTPEQFDGLQRNLAEHVLKLHETTGEQFGRITSTGQVAAFATWHDCYRAQFDSVVRDMEKATLIPVKQRKQISKVHERLERFLHHEGPPRLLHGDLWSTNLLSRPDECGVWRVAAMLDPNARFGCPEAELAYLDLFKTVTPVFMRTYQGEKKLTAEYHQVRKPIYQLYSLMNHVRAFGQEYAKALAAQVEKVSPLI